MSARLHVVIVAGLVACSPEPEGDPPELEACFQVAEGDLVDIATERSEAPALAANTPYRVNLLPDVAGYLSFTLEAGPWVLLADHPGAVVAVLEGDDRIDVPPNDVSPSCPDAVPQRAVVDLQAGTVLLEIGPVFQAAVWLMVVPDVTDEG